MRSAGISSRCSREIPNEACPSVGYAIVGTWKIGPVPERFVKTSVHPKPDEVPGMDGRR